jgi:hypothetical protein
MDIFERLGKIDNRIIYTLLVIVLLIPLARPIGLPVSVGPYVKKSFEVIDKLQAGDIIIMEAGYSISGASDVEPQTIAILKHLMKKGVKVIWTSVIAEGGSIVENLMAPHEKAGKKYGEDFVNLGYLSGVENAIATYSRDLKKAYPKDFRGNSTATLPLLKNVNSVSDVKMYIFFTTGNADMYVRQVFPYKVPLIGGLISTISLQAEPYVQSGQLAGILSGLRGGAEYETVMKDPGIGVASMDAQSMGHVLIVLFIIFANVSYFVTRSREAAKRQKGA